MPSITVPGAILGASALSAGTSILSSANQAGAAKTAAQAQENAANQASATQLQMFNQTRDSLAPFSGAGVNALAALNYGLGIGPNAMPGQGMGQQTGAPNFTDYVDGSPDLLAAYNANPGGQTKDQFGQWHWTHYGQNEVTNGGRAYTPFGPKQAAGAAPAGPTGIGTGNGLSFGSLSAPFNPQNLQDTPGYKFQFQQGLDALTNRATATGGVGGGNTLKAITQYGQGLAGTTYQQALQNYMAQQNQQFGQLYDVTSLGGNAAAGVGNQAIATGNSIANNMIGAGNASAAGTVGAANAWAGVPSSLTSNYLTAAMLQGGGGGGFWGGGGGSPLYGLPDLNMAG